MSQVENIIKFQERFDNLVAITGYSYLVYPYKNKKVDGLCGKYVLWKILQKGDHLPMKRIPKSKAL